MRSPWRWTTLAVLSTGLLLTCDCATTLATIVSLLRYSSATA
jgi:hypothetical protein